MKPLAPIALFALLVAAGPVSAEPNDELYFELDEVFDVFEAGDPEDLLDETELPMPLATRDELRYEEKLGFDDWKNNKRPEYAALLGVDEGGQVHHAIERQTYYRYPGVFTLDELHALPNMRGIRPELEGRRQLHNSAIRSAWNRIYKALNTEIDARGLKPNTRGYNALVRRRIDEGRRYIDWRFNIFFSENHLPYARGDILIREAGEAVKGRDFRALRRGATALGVSMLLLVAEGALAAAVTTTIEVPNRDIRGASEIMKDPDKAPEFFSARMLADSLVTARREIAEQHAMKIGEVNAGLILAALTKRDEQALAGYLDDAGEFLMDHADELDTVLFNLRATVLSKEAELLDKAKEAREFGGYIASGAGIAALTYFGFDILQIQAMKNGLDGYATNIENAVQAAHALNVETRQWLEEADTQRNAIADVWYKEIGVHVGANLELIVQEEEVLYERWKDRHPDAAVAGQSADATRIRAFQEFELERARQTNRFETQTLLGVRRQLLGAQESQSPFGASGSVGTRITYTGSGMFTTKLDDWFAKQKNLLQDQHRKELARFDETPKARSLIALHQQREVSFLYDLQEKKSQLGHSLEALGARNRLYPGSIGPPKSKADFMLQLLNSRRVTATDDWARGIVTQQRSAWDDINQRHRNEFAALQTRQRDPFESQRQSPVFTPTRRADVSPTHSPATLPRFPSRQEPAINIHRPDPHVQNFRMMNDLNTKKHQISVFHQPTRHFEPPKQLRREAPDPKPQVCTGGGAWIPAGHCGLSR